MNKILYALIILFALTFSLKADTDGNVSLSKKNSGEIKDCFEKVNRATFAFNQGLDNLIFEPVAKVYRKLPVPIKKGTGNMMTNISNLVTIPNNVLQGDFKEAGVNSARLVINTTVGILGIFDAATAMGFSEYRKEDYGQTLGVLGSDYGCYVVLPVLGPRSTRDAVGSVIGFMGGDPWYNVTVKNDTNYFNEKDYYYSRGTSGIDFRAKNIDTFENLEKNSIDFYASVRSLYLQDRKAKILNSKKVYDTQSDEDWEEIDN